MSYEDIVEAHERIEKFVHKTPIITNATVDKLVGRKVFFKCENLQKTGSFKVRGALNAVLKLKEREPDTTGVITHSSGNHGQALAWAAKIVGIPSTVVVPEGTPAVKCDAIRGYGARLVMCEPTPQGREETCQKLAKETKQYFVSSYENYDVIAGQGTMGLEMMDQVDDLDAILVTLSGGGMSSGICLATKHIKPSIKVFAVEPEGKELGPCLVSGKRLWPNPPKFIDTIAEGIRLQQVGHVTFPILLDHLEKEVFTVTDQEICDAMKFAWQRMKLVIESSSSVCVSAVLSQKMSNMDPSLKRIGVILSGGNVDLDALPWCKT